MSQVTIRQLLEGAKGRIQCTSPVGIAVYPHLLTHDEYQLKENNKHECNTGLRLSGSDPDAAAFIEKLEGMATEAFEESRAMLQERIDSGELKGKKLADAKANLADLACHAPYEPDYDDDGNETGDFIVRAKTKVSDIDKKTGQRWNREVAIFDSKGQKVEGAARASMKLWGGSKIALAVQVVPFCAEGLKKAGISLRLGAVQVIELSGSSATADDYGFGVEDGGYTADTFEAASGETNTPAPADDEDDEDF